MMIPVRGQTTPGGQPRRILADGLVLDGHRAWCRCTDVCEEPGADWCSHRWWRLLLPSCRVRQVKRTVQFRAVEVCPRYQRISEPGPIEDRACQIRGREKRAGEVGSPKVCVREICSGQVSVGEVGLGKVNPAESCSCQIRACKIRLSQINSSAVGVIMADVSAAYHRHGCLYVRPQPWPPFQRCRRLLVLPVHITVGCVGVGKSGRLAHERGKHLYHGRMIARRVTSDTFQRVDTTQPDGQLC